MFCITIKADRRPLGRPLSLPDAAEAAWAHGAPSSGLALPIPPLQPATGQASGQGARILDFAETTVTGQSLGGFSSSFARQKKIGGALCESRQEHGQSLGGHGSVAALVWRAIISRTRMAKPGNIGLTMSQTWRDANRWRPQGRKSLDNSAQQRGPSFQRIPSPCLLIPPSAKACMFENVRINPEVSICIASRHLLASRRDIAPL